MPLLTSRYMDYPNPYSSTPHMIPSPSPTQQTPPQNAFNGGQQSQHEYTFNPPSTEQPRHASYQHPSTSAPPSSGSNMIPEQLPPPDSVSQAQGQVPPPQQQSQQQPQQEQEQGQQASGTPQFDIFEWYPKYQSCQRYFTHHAQHGDQVQAVAAFINIHLPFQRIGTGAPQPRQNPSSSSTTAPPIFTPPPLPSPSSSQQPHYTSISLIPYLRRLVVTGLDFTGVLHGFFGDDWQAGIGPLHEQERRNYLFAAKSGGWASVKRDYDMGVLETVPFMRPITEPAEQEVLAAEKAWSEWLALEDWMVGERAPDGFESRQGAGVGGSGGVGGGSGVGGAGAQHPHQREQQQGGQGGHGGQRGLAGQGGQQQAGYQHMGGSGTQQASHGAENGHILSPGGANR